MAVRTEPRIRRPVVTDGQGLGDVIFQAFDADAREFSHRSNFADVAAGNCEAERLLGSRRSFGWVTTAGGTVIDGAIAMHGNDVAWVGPIVVRPDAQGRGAGRVAHAGIDVGYSTPRLYPSVPPPGRAERPLGDPLRYQGILDYADTSTVLEAVPQRSLDVDLATPPELPAIRTMCRRIYGIDRGLEISAALAAGRLLRRARGRLSRYLNPGVFGHGTAVDTASAIELVQHAAWLVQRPSRFLIFLRKAGLYRRAIEASCRPVKVMNLMPWGTYVAPNGFSCPSILF